MVSRRQVLHALPALAAIGMPSVAPAQSHYPERMVRIIVGNAPGGTDDVISRLLAKTLAAELGQSVIVENRGGGSTTIAGAHVAQSPPDGHTILCLINTGIVQPVLRQKLGYRLNSFAPIIGVGGFPLCLAVSTVSKITSIDDLKSLAASPQGIKYSSGGVGTMAHLNSVRFLKAIRGTGLNIPYRNNVEGLSGLMAGDTQMMFASESEVAALRPGGKIRALAMTSSKRAASMPDVPTTAELGFPTIDTLLWHGFVAPAGTPPAIVARLAESIAKGVKDPEFGNALKPLGFVEDIRTGEPLDAFINSEAARWREVIVENNIKVDD